MTDKQKNMERIGGRTFFFAWVIIGVLATYSYHTLFWMVFPMMTTDMNNTSVGNSLAIIVAFIVFSGVGFLQQYVLYRFWGIQIRHWWWVTGVGFAISQITFNGIIALLDLIPFSFIDIATVTMVISLSLTIKISVACSIQAFLLRNYLKRI